MQTNNKPRRRRIFRIVGAFLLLICVVFLDLMGILGALLVPVLGDAMDWRAHYIAGWRTAAWESARMPPRRVNARLRPNRRVGRFESSTIFKDSIPALLAES
jgi:hypothetical protein